MSWSRLLRQISLCMAIFLLVFSSRPALAQEGGDRYAEPAPLVAAPQPGLLNLSVRFSPPTLAYNQEFKVSLQLSGKSSGACYGIPSRPVDLFLVVDNSASAGTGAPDTNLYVTRWLLYSLVNQMDQDLYLPPVMPENLRLVRSRIGLILSNLTQTGEEIFQQPLSDDFNLIRQVIGQITRGGDTDLAGGVDLAAKQLVQREDQTNVPVIALVLHDEVVITDQLIAAARRAQDAGIEIYLLRNAQFLRNPESAIDEDDAQKLVDLEHYLPEPAPEEMRRFFIRITQGSLHALASEVVVKNWWDPKLAEILALDIHGSNPEASTVIWQAGLLGSDDDARWSYQAMLRKPETLAEAIYNVSAISYLDCNGYYTRDSFSTQFQPTDIPLLPDFTQAATGLPGNLTPAVTGVAASPTATHTPIPHLPPRDMLPELPIGDGLALPNWFIWLLLLPLLLFLLWLIWRLLRWLRPERRSSPGPSTPPPPPTPKLEEPPIDDVPAWIKRLGKEEILIKPGLGKVLDPLLNVELQDTLLIGVGPVGRQVLSSLAVNIKSRLSAEEAQRIRLLQVDIQPPSLGAPTLTAPHGLEPEQWVLLRPNYNEIRELLRSDPDRSAHWRWYQDSAPTHERADGRLAVFYDLKDGPDSSRLWQGIKKAWIGLDHPAVRIIGSTFDDYSSGLLVDLAWIVQNILEHAVDVQLWLAGPLNGEWSTRINDSTKRLSSRDQVARTLATLRELERFQRNLSTPFYYVRSESRHDILRQVGQTAVVQTVFIFQPLHAVVQGQSENARPEGDVLACMEDCLTALLLKTVNQHLLDLQRRRRVDFSARVNTTGRGAVSAMGSYSIRIPGALLERAIAWRMVREVLFEKALGIAPRESLVSTNGRYEVFSEPQASVDRTSIETLVARYRDRLNSVDFARRIRLEVEQLLNGGVDPEYFLLNRVGGLKRAISWLLALQPFLRADGNSQRALQWTRKLLGALQEWQAWWSNALYPSVKNELEAAHKALQDLGQEAARTWEISRELEWPMYRLEIRPWNERPIGGVNSEPLLRMARRFGWQVLFNPDEDAFEVRFVIPTPDFQYFEGVDLDQFVSPRQPQTLLRSLYALAAPLAYAAIQKSSVMVQADEATIVQWVEKARPRLKFNEAAEEINKSALLVAHRSEIAQGFYNKLRNSPDLGGQLSLDESGDANAITLIRMVDWVSMENLSLYDETAWRGQRIGPAFYVWPEQQRAAEVEVVSGRRVCQSFSEWLSADADLLHLFGLGLIYEQIKEESGVWQGQGLGNLGRGALEEVVGRLLERRQQITAGDRQGLQRAVQRARSGLVFQRLAHFEKVQRTLIDPLLAEDSPLLRRDLGYYLQVLLEKESKA